MRFLIAVSVCDQRLRNVWGLRSAALSDMQRKQEVGTSERFHREVCRPQVHRMRRVSPSQMRHLLIFITPSIHNPDAAAADA